MGKLINTLTYFNFFGFIFLLFVGKNLTIQNSFLSKIYSHTHVFLTSHSLSYLLVLFCFLSFVVTWIVKCLFPFFPIWFHRQMVPKYLRTIWTMPASINEFIGLLQSSRWLRGSCTTEVITCCSLNYCFD